MNPLASATSQGLHRIIADKQAAHRVPGVAAGIGRDGQLLWCEGLGTADIADPSLIPSDDTQFLIASLTKTFTAVVVMALRDEGKLRLDDPLDVHIPESKQAGVTIRQMLCHTSGMPHEPVGDVLDTLIHPDREELVEGWNASEQVLKPHFRWHYSSLAFSMLGEVVTRVDQRPWAESLQARILDPLELKRTTIGFSSGPAAVGYYVSPYSDVPALEPILDGKAMDPAGALASTVRDMVTWGTFLADPTDEVLKEDTVEEMCQPQIMADVDRWQMAWGLGLMLVRDGDRIWAGHTGAAPGQITGLMVQRQSKLVATVMMNATSAPEPADAAIELGSHVLDHEPDPVEPWRAGSEIPVELAGLMGRWFCFGQPIDFSVRDGRLQARGPEDPAWMSSSVFTRVADDLYRTTSGPETGELLRISRGSSGDVSHFNWATYRYTREPLAIGQWLVAGESPQSDLT